MSETKSGSYIQNIRGEMTEYSDDSLFNITSFGTDMTFRELICMYDEGDLEKPEMQRNYVWNKNEASRFIDSILLGLPVPSIFLAKTSDEKRLIVDGYQRIKTVYDYVHRGVFGTEDKAFALSNSEIINKRWRGKTFQTLKIEEQRKLRNTSIHAIVFEQKEPKDNTGMYQIFERINTSGRSLKPQEIRNCVYHGKFNTLLIKLNNNEIWREIYGDKEKNSRMSDIELILRMFAFSYLHNQKEYEQKRINLIRYLNIFMEQNNNLDIVDESTLENQFIEIMGFFYKSYDKNIFRNGKIVDNSVVFSSKINPAILDALYVGTLFVKEKVGLESFYKQDLKSNYEELIKNVEFQNAISKRTTDINTIKTRTSLATKILYGVTYEW